MLFSRALCGKRPGDERIPSALGQVYAGLGRKNEAIREGLRGVEMLPYEKEAMRGAQRVMDLAAIYARVGEPELAIERLEFLLERPAAISDSNAAGRPGMGPDPRTFAVSSTGGGLARLQNRYVPARRVSKK